MPLLVAGNIRAGCGVDCVEKIREAAHFLLALQPRLARCGLGVHAGGGVAVANTGDNNGVIIFRNHQVVLLGEVHANLVVQVQVLA